MPARYMKHKFTCEICNESFRPSTWIYYCQHCRYFIHFTCIAAKAPSEDAGFYNDSLYPLSLVMIRELKAIEKHNFGYDYSVEEAHHKYVVELEDRRLPEARVDSHRHSLVLNSDHQQHEDGDEMICDGCIEPSSPYYKCGQHCNFFLHTTCAALPIHRGAGQHWHRKDRASPKLKLYFPKNPWEVVKCEACSSFCNGCAYKCTKSGCNFCLDIKCCYLIGSFTHIGHKHHLVSNLHWFAPSTTCSGCGKNHDNTYRFYCDTCKFRLGYSCATLPATVMHRWDKHPLTLSFPPHIRGTDTVGDEEFYCEACEEEIHPKHWMYRCAECDQSFHPRCIPHCLTLVPQAKLTSICHTCRKSLYWSRVFECAPCGFYLCLDCIVKEELVVDD